jgi:hypothetical protein
MSSVVERQHHESGSGNDNDPSGRHDHAGSGNGRTTRGCAASASRSTRRSDHFFNARGNRGCREHTTVVPIRIPAIERAGTDIGERGAVIGNVSPRSYSIAFDESAARGIIDPCAVVVERVNR